MKTADYKITIVAKSDEEAWENLMDLLRIISPDFFSVEGLRTDGTRKIYMERNIETPDDTKSEKEKPKSENVKEAENILAGLSDLLCQKINSVTKDENLKHLLSDLIVPFLKKQKPTDNEKIHL